MNGGRRELSLSCLGHDRTYPLDKSFDVVLILQIAEAIDSEKQPSFSNDQLSCDGASRGSVRYRNCEPDGKIKAVASFVNSVSDCARAPAIKTENMMLVTKALRNMERPLKPLCPSLTSALL